uniref:PPPDE domain-containing protein n=1 Tax=Kalanchoe fedtschenkoi TaxID=63787 RepID=A0A7N0SZ97_KALFE
MKAKRSCGWCSVFPLPWKDRSTTDFCTFSKVESEECVPGKTPVYLNVYDLTAANGCLYWAGIGAFHTGIEVHGTEFAFGSHEFSASGIFEVDPHECPGFTFRKSILIGTTSLDDDEVRDFMDLQSVRYYGNTYHLIYKNCNHFSADLCQKMTGNPIPKWVNRLAKIGSKCTTVLPKSIKGTKVCHSDDTKDDISETKRLKSSFGCFSSLYMSQNQKEVTLTSLFITSHHKDCIPSWLLRRPKHDSCKKA